MSRTLQKIKHFQKILKIRDDRQLLVKPSENGMSITGKSRSRKSFARQKIQDFVRHPGIFGIGHPIFGSLH